MIDVRKEHLLSTSRCRHGHEIDACESRYMFSSSRTIDGYNRAVPCSILQCSIVLSACL